MIDIDNLYKLKIRSYFKLPFIITEFGLDVDLDVICFLMSEVG